jgi:Cu+-exporting ATPase
MKSRTLATLAAVLVIASATSPVLAQQTAPPPVTFVRVSDMHCAACAKKIARKLYAVPAVVQVKTDLKKHTAVITPEKKLQPNPLAIWEAVEAAGFEPVELNGPAGKFTSKEDLEKAFKRTARRP